MRRVSAFNITGGGNYCAGGSGVLVGLEADLKQGVQHRLPQNATPIGSNVPGNRCGGLSFALQLTGSYNGYRLSESKHIFQ